MRQDKEEDWHPEDEGCRLHPSCKKCPEPICAMDLTGGIRAYLLYKALREKLDAGSDIDTAAAELGITSDTARKRFTRYNKTVLAILR